MRALLDTNIVIHRENVKATNLSIGQLFHWLDVLHYEKIIHPYTVNELRKYSSEQIQTLYDAKLAAYTQMKSVAIQSPDFKKLLDDTPKTDNDIIDNQLLFELYCGRADIIITEDRKMRIKAKKLGIADKVFTINAFITKATAENPDLIEYKFLSVRKEVFGKIDVKNAFLIHLEKPIPDLKGGFQKNAMKKLMLAVMTGEKFWAFYI